MDASKKQREPVAFKSLAELKRFIRPGVEFKTVSHANHADMVGLTRVVTTVQTVGFYSKVKDQPEHPFSTCNHGKGFYTDFGKAGNYIFDGTTVKVKDARKQDRGVIYELEFYDREQNMEETMMDRKMVNFIKEQYPSGTRIRLNAMDDPYAPILPGTEGEVDFVDDAGQLHMKWDNGRSLALIPGEDSFTVLPPKLTTLKLYMPLTADLYERNKYGEFDDSSTLLEGSELRGYQDQIMAALVKNRMPEEAERGLMHWYDEADSVDRKVRSAVFTVEAHGRQLWGVAECRVAGELSDMELENLKEYLTGQASDGWGEGFEQREISVDDGGELHVHLWNSDEWSIQTEQELFSPKLAEGLPEMCFSTLPGTGELICIKRGESGYYPSDWNTNKSCCCWAVNWEQRIPLPRNAQRNRRNHLHFHPPTKICAECLRISSSIAASQEMWWRTLPRPDFCMRMPNITTPCLLVRIQMVFPATPTSAAPTAMEKPSA